LSLFTNSYFLTDVNAFFFNFFAGESSAIFSLLTNSGIFFSHVKTSKNNLSVAGMKKLEVLFIQIEEKEISIYSIINCFIIV